MNSPAIYEELDRAVEQMLATPETELTHGTEIDELMEIAAELRVLPRANFKQRLQLELEWEAAGRAVSAVTVQQQKKPAKAANEVLPSLFGKPWGGYPVRRVNFALSVALHGVMALLVGAGFLMVKSATPQVDRPVDKIVLLSPYPPPLGTKESHGGGSGGAKEKTLASRGMAPPSAREQLTPPIILHDNRQPKLTAKATVIAPPDVNVAKMREVGDPLSALAAPSNGPGINGGMGGKFGGGVGDNGDGAGRGPGSDRGCCGGVYTPGNGVSMPRAIYSPNPEFSEEARKTKHQGVVILLATIGVDGRPHELTVVRSLGMGLDEKALEAVQTWKFEPAKKDGRPVAVQMNIIVNFNLF